MGSRYITFRMVYFTEGREGSLHLKRVPRSQKYLHARSYSSSLSNCRFLKDTGFPFMRYRVEEFELMRKSDC